MYAPTFRSLAAAVLAVGCCAATAHAQEFERYTLGDEKKLEIVVHIFGQVQKPGEYQVPDGTSVLELLSKAGGPTEFSNLGQVTVTHTISAVPGGPIAAHDGDGPLVARDGAPSFGTEGTRVERVDLSSFLRNPDPFKMPVLQPGDVVSIPSNGRSTWKFASAILRDLSVVASAYFLGVRAFKD